MPRGHNKNKHQQSNSLHGQGHAMTLDDSQCIELTWSILVIYFFEGEGGGNFMSFKLGRDAELPVVCPRVGSRVLVTGCGSPEVHGVSWSLSLSGARGNGIARKK